MKRNFTILLAGLGIGTSLMAQTLVTGPSSSQAPYLQPVNSGYSITSIVTATQVVNGYTVAGIPDGSGAYDNNDGTFTFLVNHEMANNGGVTHAHGSLGAFVSKWIINKNTLAVVSGTDLIQNVKLWTGTTYTTYNATNPSTLAAFTRFCGGDLPVVTAYYNKATGRGTQERIFMNGEESGSEGRILAHIATGPDAGTSYELPLLGKFSCENQVACPRRSDKTIVIGMDDATPGQVYVYVGNKGTIGTEIDKAGLTNGLLYGVSVAGMINETSTLVPSANTTFSLVGINGSLNLLTATGATLNTVSNNLGITNFLRPEDGCWDPSRLSDFYFVTTNAFTSPSRMWRLRFNDIENPQLGGTITAVLDGTEGQVMMDNIGIDNSGHILIQEDVGNQAHNGKIWSYDIATNVLTQIANHDANLFISGGSGYLTQDEESSGIFDAQTILGPGKFLFVDQAHYPISGAAYEGGQILMLNSLNTATSNPEINVQGNAVNINMGSFTANTSNNTDFGMVNVGSTINKTFVIQNTGTGALVISGMDFTGANAGDFTFVNPPAYPATIAAGASLTITAKYVPALVGISNATLNIYNNDFNENIYDYAVKAQAASYEINVTGNNSSILAGSTVVANSNNTDFGSTLINTNITKSFVIENTGNGTLTVSGITISGANASDFTLVNPPTFPMVLTGVSSQTITVKYAPTAVATSVAKLTINNTDMDESIYDFAIQGKGLLDVGVQTINKASAAVKLFPNPAKDEVAILLQLENREQVKIDIYDLTGKRVSSFEKTAEGGEQTIKMNTSNLANGEYFVKVSIAEKVNTLKLVVTH